MSEAYAGFNATAFRDAIIFAMTMGTPATTSQRATFAWTPRKTYPIGDEGNEPFDWTLNPTTTIAPAPVEIPCVVETGRSVSTSDTTPIGTIDSGLGVVTILDQHYPQIFDDDDVRADLMIIDTNTYDIKYELPPVGLFNVTVHQLTLQARDES